jgi:hypothetical protein
MIKLHFFFFPLNELIFKKKNFFLLQNLNFRLRIRRGY